MPMCVCMCVLYPHEQQMTSYKLNAGKSDPKLRTSQTDFFPDGVCSEFRVLELSLDYSQCSTYSNVLGMGFELFNLILPGWAVYLVFVSFIQSKKWTM